jgi:hypothetical protein
VWFETGVIGLVLFVGVFFWLMKQVHSRMSEADGVLREAFAAAFLGMLVFAINACTDNPLQYNLWFTNPLFALIGACYGVARAGSSAPWSSRSQARRGGSWNVDREPGR